MILSSIIVAIALATRMLLLMRNSSWGQSLRLTSGLAVSAAVAFVHSVLLYAAMLVGYILRFSQELYSTANTMVFVGLIAMVSVRWLFKIRRKDSSAPAYSIATGKAVLQLALASGINVFLIGLGFGFVCSEPNLWLVLPLFVLTFVGAYFGVMFGRRKVAMRERRWQLMSVILLVASLLIGLTVV